MLLSIHVPQITNHGIDKCLNKWDYPRIIHRTLPLFLYTCISPMCTNFSLSFINYNIVVTDIL